MVIYVFVWDYPYKLGGVLMADKVKLECTVCKNRNYDTTKNKKNTQERLELKKYCPVKNTLFIKKQNSKEF